MAEVEVGFAGVGDDKGGLAGGSGDNDGDGKCGGRQVGEQYDGGEADDGSG